MGENKATAAAPLLVLRGIARRYGTIQANAGIDLEVAAGSVLGLVGENGSGKSTLMKILFGLVRPDAGSITMRGIALTDHCPAEAIQAGLGMVHQHFMLFDAMTVAENIRLGLGAAARRGSMRATIRTVRALSMRFGLDLDPDARVSGLPLGRRQRVEIVKALMRGAELLIMDEPTSNLAPAEVAQLFDTIRRLRAAGNSVIFISHKLGEVIDLCDDIAVLRAGRIVARMPAAGASRDMLGRQMLGSDAAPVAARIAGRPGGGPPGRNRMVLENLVLAYGSPASPPPPIQLELRAGEVLAIAGIDGNGQQELADTIAGLRAPRAGRVLAGGRDMTHASVQSRIAAGIAYIPADRATTSLAPRLSVAENLMLRDSTRPPFARCLVLSRAGMAAAGVRAMADYAIRAASPRSAAGSLSGGNQQKIVLAREIGRAPQVLVALQPGWGLDPGSVAFVIGQVMRLRDQGAAILYISAELEEVLAVGDRIGVMFAGGLAGIMPRSEATTARLGLMMGGALAA